MTHAQEDAPAPGGQHRLRLTALVAAAVVAVLVATYLGAYLWVGSSIPRGTTVAGVDVGGMAPSRAVAVLQAELGERASTVRLQVADRVRELPAARVGLSFDPALTVAAIPGRDPAPQALISQMGGQVVDPVIEVDQQRLDRVVSSIARTIDDPVRQARIEYDHTSVVVIPPRSGRELDQQAAVSAIVGRYLTTDEPTVLEAEPAAPYVSAEEAQAFAATDATDAVSAPVTLSVGGRDVEVTADQIASVLSYRATAAGMAPSVDAELLRELVADQLTQIGRPARDATFDVSSGRPVVVPARTGVGVDDASLRSGLVAAIGSPSRSASLELERVQPDLTTAEARDLGVTEKISTFTQWFPYAAYRVTNIGIASDKINGTVLEPGETFSLNGVVGERTPENGFVKGYVISGSRLVEDYGGAVSTITTAMWHTAFYAGMTRVEQRAHGFWISRYTAGLEATVSWGYLDLKFRNDTPYGVFITSSLTDTSVTVTMWSTKYWDITAEFGPRQNLTSPATVYDTGAGCVPQTGVSGFDITVTRVWSHDGQVEKRETLPTHYDAAPTVICGPEPTEEPDKGDKQDDPKGANDDRGGGGSGGGSGSGGGGGDGGGGGGGAGGSG